ncbi:MAG: insulinase family protein [Candidatus Omnitrophica bacterium]|nr:insulinase family protein [Candidatus Omnitrophota bacterium]
MKPSPWADFKAALPECRSTQIPGGPRVVTVSLPDRRSIAAAVWIRTGSRFENEAQSGIAHFLEHMVFKGTKTRSAQRIKEAVEGKGGQLNAFTGEESTCFFVRVLKPYFGEALEVLADMIQNAELDPREVRKEKAVILEEIKMYRDVASQHVQDMMGELLWPDHPLGRPISGTESSVGPLTSGVLKSFRDLHYRGSNAVVSIAGPVDHEPIVKLVSRLFPSDPQAAGPVFSQAHPKSQGSACRFIAKKTHQTHFVVGLEAFSRYDRRRFGLALLSLILGGNMSSRLFEKIREQKGLAYDIRSTPSFYQDTGALLISAGVESSRSRDVIRLILKELSLLTRDCVSSGELRRAKDHFLGQFFISLEDPLEYLLWAGENVLYRPELPQPESLAEGISKVTAADLKKIAAELFVNGRYHLAMIGPERTSERAEIEKILK